MKVIDNVLRFLFGAFLGLVFFGSLALCAVPHLEKAKAKRVEPEVVPVSVKVDYEPQEEETTKTVYLGEFVLTAYCGENYHHICNDGNFDVTSTGVKPQQGRTIAVDPKVIPYGSIILIDGVEYVAEDCGGAIKGNRIDVFFESHKDALEFGKRVSVVELVVK